MCGIAGFVGPNDRLQLSRMAEGVQHRGPDQEGVYEDPRFSVAHKRLSIIDLSEQGRQPMSDPSGRFVVAFNGEIYNYQALRARYTQLGWKFRTQTDTECILAAACLGVLERDIQSFHGIFAFVVWDVQEGMALLARDRAGIKPLFFTEHHQKWYFASEIPALLVTRPSWDMHRSGVGAYLSIGFIPGPKTIYEGIESLEPGVLWRLQEGRLRSVSRFDQVKESDELLFSNKDQAIRELRELVYASIHDQCISDRPVGVFLSGGLDSSVILAGMRKQRSEAEIRSFTTRFAHHTNDPKFNIDAELARKTAAQYGAIHTEIEVSAEDVMRRSEQIAFALGQPDNNYAVAALDALASRAAQDVAVVLAGDGGDELFGGYERYRLMQRWERWFSQGWFRSLARVGAKALSRGEAWHDLVRAETRSERFRTFFAPPLARRRELFGAAVTDVYAAERFAALDDADQRDAVQAFMALDRAAWLRDDAFVRGDRLSMQHGLELRIPLTDDRLLAFVRRLPSSWLIRGGVTKALWREAFAQDCLPEIIHAPKRGWITPTAKWLREPAMQRWTKEVLEEAIADHAWMNGAAIRRLFDDHLAKRGYYLTELWTIIAFQLWWRGAQSWLRSSV